MHACTQVVLDWFGKLLGLPQQFLTYSSDGKQLPGGGVIQARPLFLCGASPKALPSDGNSYILAVHLCCLSSSCPVTTL